MSINNDILWARHRLGYNVRLVRLVLEMTQSQLADKADMDRAFISDVERGKVAASMDAIARLATALEIPVHWLLRVHNDVVLPAKFRPAQPPTGLSTPPGERHNAPEPDDSAEPYPTSNNSER